MYQIELLDLIVEPDNYKVYRNEENINLPKLSFELFMYLLENSQKICTLEGISLAVWKNTEVSSETVIQRITLLRKVLNDDPKTPKYIESVRGRGYRLIAKPSHQTNNNNKKFLLVGTILFLLISAVIMVYSSIEQTIPHSSMTSPQIKKVNKLINSLIERGNYYHSIGQKKNLERAMELFNEVLKNEPSNINALVGLSLALSKSVCRYNQLSSRALKAKQLAEQAIILDTNSSKAEAALAYSWDCLGDIELALEHYLLAIKLDPQNYRSIGSAAYLLQTKGQLLAAYKLNKRAKQLKPNNHMVDLQIANILELLNFTTQAQARYQKLFMLFPDNVFINEAYPRFLFFQGRFTQAKEMIETVLKRDIDRNNIVIYYAELLWLLKGKEKALPWFRRAAKVNPNQSYPKTVQQIMDNQLTVTEVKNRINSIEEMVAQGDSWPINYIEASLMALWIIKNQNKAIDYLQKAVEFGYLDSEYLTISPLFAQLRKQPRFYQLIDDINQRREQMKQKFLAAYPLTETE